MTMISYIPAGLSYDTCTMNIAGKNWNADMTGRKVHGYMHKLTWYIKSWEQ